MKILFATILVISFVFFSCNSNKNNAVENYYNTVKEQLHEKNKKINAILKNMADEPEVDLATLKNLSEIPEAVKNCMDTAVPIKSKVAPIASSNCLFVNIERLKSKSVYEYFSNDNEVGNLFSEDIIYKLAQNDSVATFTSVVIADTMEAALQKAVSNYLQLKYLLVADCIYFYHPGQTTTKQLYEKNFELGELVKRISIYDIATQQLSDSYYVYAISSEKVKVDKYGGGLLLNLANNWETAFKKTLE